MKKVDDTYIKSVTDFIKSIEGWAAETTTLFRGQNSNKPLIPKIARDDPSNDTTDLERIMIQEFRRRGAQNPNIIGKDDWDCLVHTQHYGMATRLLDWTSNPLVALWFACCDLNHDKSGYVYAIFVDETDILDKKTDKSPYTISKTKVFKPNINNPRVASQSGWFTVHRYSKKNSKFVPLEKNKELKNKVYVLEVPGKHKIEIFKNLDKVGINYESIYPGIEGTCRYVNWIHKIGF